MRSVFPEEYCGSSPSVSMVLRVRLDGNALSFTVTSPRRSTYFRAVQFAKAFSATVRLPVPYLETEIRL